MLLARSARPPPRHVGRQREGSRKRLGRPEAAGAVDGDPSAALLGRGWFEAGTQSFRCRITSRDTTPGRRDAEEVTVALTSSAGDVVGAVRAWLDDVLREASGGQDRD